MLTVILTLVLCMLLIAIVCKGVLKAQCKYADIPAVAYRFPIIGNYLDASKMHLVLTDWAKLYGPIFRFSLYGEEIVVLNDYQSISEALVKNGSDFAGRPDMKRTNYQDRNKHSIVWQTYTPKLQFLRKQIHSSLRMYGGGLERLQDRCGIEMQQLLARIESQDGQPFDHWSMLYDSACNIMLDLSLGIRLDYHGNELTRLKEINGLFNHSFGPGVNPILDRISALNFLQTEYQVLKKAVHMRNQFWLDTRDKLNNLPKANSDGDSVVSHLENIAANPRYAMHEISESTLKETFTNLVLAGTDTTTTALACFLVVLLQGSDVQNRLHAEIDHVIGPLRCPALSDRSKMPYMEACLLEILRFTSHVPLAVPHSTIRDTTISGKKIPKNTTVYINLWALHHDENCWHDPWEFDPQRFLDSEGQLVPSHHECRKRLMAFGAGRRVCLGEALAKNRLFLFAAALLQKFFFKPAVGDHIEKLDPRKFALGIVLHPGLFHIKAIPRTCVNIGYT